MFATDMPLYLYSKQAGTQEGQVIFTVEGGELTEPAVVVPGQPPRSEVAQTDRTGQLAGWHDCGRFHRAVWQRWPR